MESDRGCQKIVLGLALFPPKRGYSGICQKLYILPAYTQYSSCCVANLNKATYHHCLSAYTKILTISSMLLPMGAEFSCMNCVNVSKMLAP